MKTGYLYSGFYGSTINLKFGEKKEDAHCLTAKDWREAAILIKVIKTINHEAFKLWRYEVATGKGNEGSQALHHTLVHGVPASEIRSVQAPATFEDVKDCYAAGHTRDFHLKAAERYFLEG